MPRNYIHDIKPSGRVQKRRDASHRAHEERLREFEETFEEREPRRGGGRGIWYVAGLAVLILVFALTFVFAGATVFVTPRTGTVELSGPLLAQKETRSGLPFEMLVFEGESSASVAAGEKHYVEKKATGNVTLYNTTAKSQNLLIDTRLETPDGLIYKTKKATVVPAAKVANGKTTPGSIAVDIYADEAGANYNKNEGEFKIVGFRGSPKYESFYARSNGAISGGFKGDSYDISDEALAAQKESLRAMLSESLLAKARAEIPKDFVLYEKATVVDFDEPEVTGAADSTQATITQKGTMNAVIFKEAELTRALVEKVIANTEENKVTIPNIRDLNIELDPTTVIGTPESTDEVKIFINDKINVVWLVNDEALKDALVGTKKREFESKMLGFKNIDKAELNLKPFWKQTMPTKPGAIRIVNTLEE